MTTGHVFIATSLDGFVARLDHGIDWLTKQQTNGEDHGFDAFVASVDGLVMGRGTFETVLSFDPWPYTKPVVVMSKTLTGGKLPLRLQDRVRVSPLEPHELMRSLKTEGWKRAYVDGGKVVQSFIREGLIEDMVLTLIPILIGQGLRLFGELAQDIDLKLQSTTAFPSGLVQTHYRLIRPGFPNDNP